MCVRVRALESGLTLRGAARLRVLPCVLARARTLKLDAARRVNETAGARA